MCGVAELCAATPCLGITDVEVAMSRSSAKKSSNGSMVHGLMRMPCSCTESHNSSTVFRGTANDINFSSPLRSFCVLRRATCTRSPAPGIRTARGARRSLSCRPCLSTRLCATVRPVRSCRSPPALREFSASNARCVSHAARHLKGGAGIGRDTHRRAGAS